MNVEEEVTIGEDDEEEVNVEEEVMIEEDDCPPTPLVVSNTDEEVGDGKK